jgi:hypothetical protein
MKLIAIFVALALLVPSPSAFGQRKEYRKVQEVNFEEMSLTGTIRNPDGAYLVQKRGLQFLPLYEVQRSFDRRIRQSLEYMD